MLAVLLGVGSTVVATPHRLADEAVAEPWSVNSDAIVIAASGGSPGVLGPSAAAFTLPPEADGSETSDMPADWSLVAVLPEPASLLLLSAGLLALFALRDRDLTGGRRRRKR